MAQAQFWQSLLDLIIKNENNSVLLINANKCDLNDYSKDNPDFFTKLVQIALNSQKKDRKPRKALVGVLNALVKKWIPKKHHFEIIYQKISQCLNSSDSDGILRSLKLLRVLSRQNIDDSENFVPNYFYFSPFNSALHIQCENSLKYEFSKGYSVILWIKLEDLQTLQRFNKTGEQIKPSLFSIKSGGKFLEFYFSGTKLLYKSETGKEIDVSTLLTNTWYCIGISHTANTKQLKVVINNEFKQMLAEFPRITEANIDEFKICDNFVGQLASAIIFKNILTKEQMLEIYAKFPYGISTNEKYKEFYNHINTAPGNPHEIYTAFSAIYADLDKDNNMIYDLHNGPIFGKFIGNTGVVKLQTPTSGPRYCISLNNLLPILDLIKITKDIKISQRLFQKLLLTAKGIASYKTMYEKGTIKAAREFKLFGKMLEFHLNNNSFNPEIATPELFSEIEEISSLNKDLEKACGWMLLETMKFWVNTESSVNSKYWEFLRKCQSIYSGYESSVICKILNGMLLISENVKSACCQLFVESMNKKKSGIAEPLVHNSLNIKFEPVSMFMHNLLENINGETLNIVVRKMIEISLNPVCCHCLYLQIINDLTDILNNHPDIALLFDPEIYPKLLIASSNYSVLIQSKCLSLLKKIISNTPNSQFSMDSLYSIICKNGIKKLTITQPSARQPAPSKEEKKIVVEDQSNSLDRPATYESEPTDEEHNTSLLQEKVLSEEANINSTIKKIKQIKIDIQETNKQSSNSKPGKQFVIPQLDPNNFNDTNSSNNSKVHRNLLYEEFNLTGGSSDFESKQNTNNLQGNNILSIEELVAQDPYKPPPAPKNEKMKQKRFFFGESSEVPSTEISEPRPIKRPNVPKLQIPTKNSEHDEIKNTENIEEIPLLEELKSINKSGQPEQKMKKSVPALNIPESENTDESETAPKKPKSFGLILGKSKVNKFLEINTENINKEFDIGGEKGKKIVDEEEENAKFEKEILELAEHCVLAMARHSPSEQIVSKYASGNRSPPSAIGQPITSTHKSLMHHQKLNLAFPQSTKERKQFTFAVENLQEGTATPIKEESLMTSKSSLARDTVHLDQEPVIQTNESAESYCAILICELIGIEYKSEEYNKILEDSKSHQIINSNAANCLIKIIRKGQQNLMPTIEFFTKLCEDETGKNKHILCENSDFHTQLFKLELNLYSEMNDNNKNINKANKLVEFEQIIQFHCILIIEALQEANSAYNFTENFTTWLINSHKSNKFIKENIADCVKYIFGKLLTLLKESQISQNAKIGLAFMPEIMLMIFCVSNEIHKENGILFNTIGVRSAPIVLYSDSEILKVLIEILGFNFWKSPEIVELPSTVISPIDLTSYFETTQEDFITSHLEPILHIGLENSQIYKDFDTLYSISFLTCLGLKNSVGVSELEYWTQEAEHILYYFLMLLEYSKFNKIDTQKIQNSFLLLLGGLLQGCCEQITPEEHHQFYSKTLAHVFQFMFNLVRITDSKTKEFYEKILISKDNKLIVPIEEINLIEGVTMAELMRILTPEYSQLLEFNIKIPEHINKLNSIFIIQIQTNILNSFAKSKIKHPENLEKPIQNLISPENLWEIIRNSHKWKKLNKKCLINSSNNFIISSHQFENGIRGILKQKAEIKNYDFANISEIISKNPNCIEKLAEFLFLKINSKIREKLPAPQKVQIKYKFHEFQGILLIYRKNNIPFLLFLNTGISQGKIFIRQKLSDIKTLYRKYENSLEITFYGGKNMQIHFENNENRDNFGSKLLRLRGKWLKQVKYYGTMDLKKGFEKQKFTEKWLNYEISTFDYLLQINNYCGNSFNEATKYPKFPQFDNFVVEDKSKLLTEQEKIKTIIHLFSQFPSFLLKYTDSTICIICDIISQNQILPENYLIPVQNLKIDTLGCICKKHENLLDLTKQDLIKSESYQKNIYLHNCLENNIPEIANWIDKNFGVQNNSKNMLFKSPHQIRSQTTRSSIFDYEYTTEMKIIDKIVSKLLNIQYDNENFYIISAEGTINQLNLEKMKIEQWGKYDPNIIVNNWTKISRKLTKNTPVKIIIHGVKNQYIVQGGYLTGTLQLSPILPGNFPTISLHYHSSSITTLAIDREERIGILGTKNGEISVFSIGENMFWGLTQTLLNHSSEITSINICEEMQIFSSCSRDGIVNIYTLENKPKLLQTIKTMGSINYAILSQFPTPEIIIFYENKISCYSLFGQELLAEISEKFDSQIEPKLVKDKDFDNYVSYIRRNELVIKKLPFLDEERVIFKSQIENIEGMGTSKYGAVIVFSDGKIGYLN